MTQPVPRDRQRGNSLLLALIVMSALATLGTLTVVSVQSSLKASTNDRFQSVALYAAESGAAAAMVYLRQVHAATGSFNSALGGPIAPFPPVFGNTLLPGAGSPFTNDQNASYTVSILPSPAEPATQDRVVIHVVGNGAQGSTSIMEWEVRWDTAWYTANPGPPWTHGLVLLGWREVLL